MEYLASTKLSLSDLKSKQQAAPGRYFCPVCGTLHREFKEGGTGKRRPNAKCPSCGSLERHRLLWLSIVTRVLPALRTGKKDVLHIAPEKFFVERLRPQPDINYISGDLFMPSAMAKVDLTDIQFWDGQFDLIVCSHVLEHIPDDRKAMDEICRVLRPDGVLLVMVPLYAGRTYEDFSITAPEERRKHFGQEDHVRKYGEDIVDRLSDSGFDVVLWPKTGDLEPSLLDFLSVNKQVVFECRKSAREQS